MGENSKKIWIKAFALLTSASCLAGVAFWSVARAQNAPAGRTQGAPAAAARAQSTDDVPVPRFKVDPSWPKQLPNNWLMKGVPRITVDRQDRVWIVTRGEEITEAEAGADQNPPTSLCCKKPPSVMAFDAQGNVVYAWGSKESLPGGLFNRRIRALILDGDGNVWIGGNDPGDTLLQFTPDGKFLRDFGHRGPAVPANQLKANNQQTDYFVHSPANPTIDPEARELYLEDAAPNRRILVYNLDTGAFKRGWGGHGTPLSEIDNGPILPFDLNGPPIKNFTPPIQCVKISRDGLVYVCNRGGDSIQVFTKQGKFLKEFFMHRMTAKGGTRINDLAFSADPTQKYMYVSDPTNGMISILRRDNGVVVGSVGHYGHMAGELQLVDGIAVDSKGNLYTGEVTPGERIQKFVLQR